MQKFLEAILDEMRKPRLPGEAVAVSVDLLKQLEPAEREEFLRRMLEESLPADAPSEVREKMEQFYLRLAESEDPESLLEQLGVEEGFD